MRVLFNESITLTLSQRERGEVFTELIIKKAANLKN